MWMKMFAFGATASILALSACVSPEGGDTESLDNTNEAELAAGVGEFCGGFAGIPCEPGLTCKDVPNDGCDPRTGGADCGGVCVADVRADGSSDELRAPSPSPSLCDYNDPNRSYVSRDPNQCAVIRFKCEDGKQPFFNECGCGCETVGGVACGNTVCGEGLYCCNASCGMCARPGMMCIQIACEDAR